MSSRFKMPQGESTLLLIIFFVYLLTRLPPLLTMPLILDEAVYSVMIEEQMANPSLIPTFLGHFTSWKPPLFFWVYSVFSRLPLPFEAVYRFPSFLFGLASVVMLYKYFRRLELGRYVSFFSALIFLFSFISLYPDSTALTDSLLFFLIIGSLYAYSQKELGSWRFGIGFLLSFAAFFVKHLVAFVIPLLAILYFYTYEKKKLRSPVFLVSLLAAPLAFAAHILLLGSLGLADDLYQTEMQVHIFGTSFEAAVLTVEGSITTLFMMLVPWLPLSFFGFWKYWRENALMSVWYLLVLVPLAGAYYMPWYFLPALPAASYFTALTLVKWEGKENVDLFFLGVFTVLVLLWAVSVVLYYDSLYKYLIPQKEVGLLLSGKENVLVLGHYPPGTISYKMNTERRKGSVKDFGWVLSHPDNTEVNLSKFVYDYRGSHYSSIVNGSFNGMFTQHKTVFRKDTNVTEFDYVAAVVLPHARDTAVSVPGSEVIYNRSYITVYKIN
ncbi:hypothetical protein GF318_01885 [Candidatus Micrarchaeota archaeon]|nr:hypothetical protein [Candidatus Micrarchaeota archaeon]